MEKHIQTLLLAVCTASIIWFGQQIFDLSIQMAKVQTTLASMTSTAKDFMTRDEITIMAKARDLELAELKRRVEANERKLDAVRPVHQ